MKLIRRKQLPTVADINIVPYVDVMLVLLVIFMITAPILTQGVQVSLPKASNDAIQTEGVEPIIVSINQRGEYFLNKSVNPDSVLSPKELMLRVAAELKMAQQNQQKPKVLVKGDQGVNYGRVVLAMTRLKRAGAEQVGLMTENED